MLSLPHGLCGWKVCAQQYQVPGGKVSRALGTSPFGPCTGHNGFLRDIQPMNRGLGNLAKEDKALPLTRSRTLEEETMEMLRWSQGWELEE